MASTRADKVAVQVRVDKDLHAYMMDQVGKVGFSRVVEEALIAMKTFLEANEFYYAKAFDYSSAVIFFSLFLKHQESCYKGDSKMIARHHVHIQEKKMTK